MVGDEFIKPQSINSEIASIWLVSHERPGYLKRYSIKCNTNDCERNCLPTTINIKDHPHCDFLQSGNNTLYILSSKELAVLLKHRLIDQGISMFGEIRHGVLIKIIYKEECWGFIELYNQLRRKGNKTLSSKGFNWLEPDSDNAVAHVNKLFLKTSQIIGTAVHRAKQIEVRSRYYSELISANSTDEARQVIWKHVREFSGADCFSYWMYNHSERELGLKYFSGIQIDPLESILKIDDSWLGELIMQDQLYGFSEHPQSAFKSNYWKNRVGNLSIFGIPLRDDNNIIFGIVTLHFQKSEHILDQPFIEKIVYYFEKCAPLIRSKRDKIENKRREEFISRVSRWLLAENLDGFFAEVVKVTKEIINAKECSLFLRNKNNMNKLTLVSTTSTIISDRISQDIYDITSDKSITTNIVKNIDGRTLFQKAGDDPNYSGGQCNEIEAMGAASVVFGRIMKNDDYVIGVIRCVERNEIIKVEETDIFIHQAFDTFDEQMMGFISRIVSVISRLLSITKKEKERAVELEHETITPLSVIIHELDELRLKISEFRDWTSLNLLEHVNPSGYDNKHNDAWSEKAKHLFNSWSRRMSVAKFEAELATSLIQKPNAADIPIEQYSMHNVQLFGVIIPLFFYSKYFININGLVLKNFHPIMVTIKKRHHRVRIDVGLFKQAFLHILNNAIKYSIPNTKARKRYGGEIWFKLDVSRIESNSILKLQVCNVGQRIDEKEHGYIWDKYFRGALARQSGKEGRGLGLYVAKKILCNLGGDVLLKNKKDVTIFELQLPLL